MQTKNQISLARKALYGIMLLGVFLSAFGGGNVPPARAQAQVVNTTATSLLQPDITAIGLTPRFLLFTSGEEPIVIDFATVLTVPNEFRSPIQTAIESSRSLLPSTNRFTVTALRRSQNWMYAVLVPTRLVESGWSAGLRPEEIVEILGRVDSGGQWVAYVQGSSDFLKLARDVPKDFFDFSLLLNKSASSLQTVEYLFPWTSGQSWMIVGRKVPFWHQGWTPNSLDFQPRNTTNPSTDLAVLAAASGTLTRVCGGTNDPYQSTLKIVDSVGGTTFYLHIDTNSFRSDLDGQNVVRGQFLGLLYNGTQGAGGRGSQYDTYCGYGDVTHIHFELPSQDMTINGISANNIANSAFGTPYTSSNTRVDDNGVGRLATLNLTVKLENPQQLSNFNHGNQVAVVVLKSSTKQILFEPSVVSTNSSGYYGGLGLSNIQPGTYDICAKARHYLGQCARNVTVNPGSTINIDFSNGGNNPAWLGDIDAYGEDNEDNILDLERIKFVILACLPHCGLEFDMNRDGVVDTQDYSLVLYRVGHDFRGEGAFNKPFGVTGQASNEGSISMSSGNGTLSIQPGFQSNWIGDTISASIVVNTGGDSISGVDAIVYYDPGILEVIDEDGGKDGIQISNAGLFPNTYRNMADPTQGVIRFSAGYGNNNSQFNGTGTLAILRFRAIAATPQLLYTMVKPVVNSDVSDDSNGAQFNTALDVLTSSSVASYIVYGTQYRPSPSISLSPTSGTIIGQTLLNVSAIVSEPYNQVECVSFGLDPNSGNSVSASDCDSSDGWGVQLDISSIPDQNDVTIWASATLRATPTAYTAESTNITLDRTAPSVWNSYTYPPYSTPGNTVQVQVSIIEALSGKVYAELWVNTANDSSDYGEWVQVDAGYVYPPPTPTWPQFLATLNWDTTGFDVGSHLIAATLQDDAGNWRSWNTIYTIRSPVSNSIYLPLVLSNYAQVIKPVFVYPAYGATLDYDGSYLFGVEPITSAQGFLWGFFQNGVSVWENLRDEGTLSGNEYGILPGTVAHSKFVPGSVDVWVRALINGQWTDATIITIYLQ